MTQMRRIDMDLILNGASPVIQRGKFRYVETTTTDFIGINSMSEKYFGMFNYKYYDSFNEWACREREPPTNGSYVLFDYQFYDRMTVLKMYDEATMLGAEFA